MTIYYMPYSAINGKMTAFKPGFRMLTGDPSEKTQGTLFTGFGAVSGASVKETPQRPVCKHDSAPGTLAQKEYYAHIIF